ncbi:hypothetical protein LAZ67_14001107 [Cordylochernes scorpioides]|uniref:Non-specific serine/threonine protein kinase n=1 Tax=Cordylochernes scorpioides TaxID=51811 RepID=A0ABY6L9W9_9ARAC|nr:hypothetical protein LAZ67_14001107 [Cordylochernes scorpioides]
MCVGCRSYGSVFKAVHKETSQLLAIKQVPVGTDFQEIIKEISIMQQCHSPHVVQYYGSYFHDTDLWVGHLPQTAIDLTTPYWQIVMEFCGGGSVADIMKKLRRTLSEEDIATILADTLQGLAYLHHKRKIHRDIKAGNILLDDEGRAKLADFGVAGQLSDTMAKRNTVIGTPFWMAPEVIQEVGYDCRADIWSLGITALEMAEGKPPYGDIHPMRAIFMIPTKPPPTFQDPNQWSPEFVDFVQHCLVKNPEERWSALQLLQHEFIRNAKPVGTLVSLLAEADATEQGDQLDGESSSPPDTKTLVPETNGHDTAPATEEEEEESTMKRHDTIEGDEEYRPSYLDHFSQQRASWTGDEVDQYNPISHPGLGAFLHHARCLNLPDIDSLSLEELGERMAKLDAELDAEIEELRRCYQVKRQPILDAIEAKQKQSNTSPVTDSP